MEDLAVVAAFVLAYALVSGRLASTWITGPMVFVLFGLAVGPDGLHWVDLSGDFAILLAEVTLVFILFNDAALIDWPTLWRNRGAPVRLLAVGLPLTIFLGAFAAWLIFDAIELWQAALAAVILAPTDAALGQAVVTNRKVPIKIRQALSVESGLNDGIAAPLVTLFVAGVAIEGGTQSGAFWLTAGKEIGLGIGLGVGIGLAGSILIGRASSFVWMTPTFRQIGVATLPVLAFAFSEVVDGNSFVAAFLAGIVFGNVARQVPGHFFEFSEETSQLLLLLTFMVFGGAFVGSALGDVTWQIALYAVLSLVVVRPLAVAVSMIGSKFHWSTVAFLGWFGPRGLASIVFGLLVLETEGLPGGHAIFLLVTWTVLVSVFVHGLSAQPGAERYGARAEAAGEDSDAPELDNVERFFLSAARMTGGGRRRPDSSRSSHDGPPPTG